MPKLDIDDDTGPLNLSNIYAQFEIASFKIKWHDHITALGEAYGPENLEVCWGFIQHYG